MSTWGVKMPLPGTFPLTLTLTLFQSTKAFDLIVALI